MKTDITQLLASLKKGNMDVSASTAKQIENLTKKAKKVIEPESQIKQEKKIKKMNYDNVKQDMDKWIPILKVNRQKEHLNFTEKYNNQIRVNFFPSNREDQFSKRINNELNQLKVGSEKQLIKAEQQKLEKLGAQQMKQKLGEIRKQRNMNFYEEIKRKRISKIKSKLYHRIKKRQKIKSQLENLNNMDPEQKQLQLEKLRSKRTLERINLRHKAKNKHIQDLMRFSKGQKNRIQDSINELNKIRREQMQKLNQEVAEDVSEEYDQENFRQQALNDLKNQIKLIQQVEHKKSGIAGLKFMENALVAKLQDDKNQAYKLMEKIANNQQISVSQQQEQIDDDQDDQLTVLKKKSDKKRKAQKKQDKQIQQYEPLSRKKFIKQNEKNKQQQSDKRQKKNNINKILDEYIQKNENTTENKSKEITEQNLIKNINITKLKQKYQPKRVQTINMKQFVQENTQLFQNIAVLQNRQQFQKEKFEEYEQLTANKEKKLKGWGSWTGPGIKQKAIDPQKQLKEKLKKIQQLKKQRKDGNNKDVIINQKRNKQFSQYLVRQLPYNYKSKQQFEYINNAPLGPEWNSMQNFKQVIKPKIITKVGEVIHPISLPKKIAKIHE